ncbi:transposase [Syntrophomonas erecta]
MPRRARQRSNTGIYHLMLRGVNRQNLFMEDEDRLKFMETIRRYKQVSNYELYAYCLMNNHVHLLVKENKESISITIKRISGSYVLWYNKKYSRCGHLFQERFRSEAVETDAYFLTVLRYIHQNPVKAGIAKEARFYRWSSYHEYIENAGIIDIEFGLNMFSENKKTAKKLFEQYTNEINNDQCLDDHEKPLTVTDTEVIEWLKKLGIPNIGELHRLDKPERDKLIRELKKMPGISIRQLARIIGISKSMIGRV